jgi:DNA-binding HxlR family transcriptional regulator
MAEFPELDPLLHSQLRLAIVSYLMGVDSADFNTLKEETGASSGNLSVQLDKLEKAGYIEVTKSFKGKKPHTSCRILQKGVEAFEAYVDALKSYLGTNKDQKR